VGYSGIQHPELCRIVEDLIALYRKDGKTLPPPTSGRDFTNKLQNVYEPKCQLDRYLAMDRTTQHAILDHGFVKVSSRGPTLAIVV
jgi:hypothetical protein